MSDRGDLVLTKPTKIKKTNKKGTQEGTGRPVVCLLTSCKLWNPGVAARIQRKIGGWRYSRTWRLSRQFLSWSIFRAHTQETWEFVWTQCLDLFLWDRSCEICKRTKITRAPSRRRNGGAVLRAENFGDLITADHKVFSDNCESWHNHRYAVVVQDLATQWIQAYPCKNKIFTRYPEKLAKAFGAREEAQTHLHWQFIGIRQTLWRSLLESLYVDTT